jgi:hypothetical protein
VKFIVEQFALHNHRGRRSAYWDVIAKAEHLGDALSLTNSEGAFRIYEFQPDHSRKLIFDNTVGKDLRA